MKLTPTTITDFPWGRVIDVHSVGEYDIIEYHARINRGQYGKNMFHPYIDDKDTHCSYHSLDEALIGAIACKHDGCNSQAAHFFGKMIGLNTPEPQ